MQIASVGRAFPPHYYSQHELVCAIDAVWSDRFHNQARLSQILHNTLVGGRHLALPLERYATLSTFTESNDVYIETATALAQRAAHDALQTAGLDATQIDHIFFVSVTGLATPSIDARLANRLGMPPSVKRTPIFGLGCVGGAAALARAADYLVGHANQTALVVSVELCSLTLQRQDPSMANLIATGLFGDGAAAVVLCGDQHSFCRPKIIATESIFYKDTEAMMGWRIGSDGFQIVLSPQVPALIHKTVEGDVDRFLASQKLTREHISRYICHCGGPKVLEAMQEALQLPKEALALSWKSLQECGNLSSASVLLVLGDTLAKNPGPPGSYGLLMAFGPGFCCEMVLLQW